MLARIEFESSKRFEIRVGRFLLPAVSRRILEILDKIDATGRLSKMDFIRIAGNEKMANDWIRYMITCNLISSFRYDGKFFFCKTNVGQKIHEALKLHPYVGPLFEDLGRMRRPTMRRIITV